MSHHVDKEIKYFSNFIILYICTYSYIATYMSVLMYFLSVCMILLVIKLTLKYSKIISYMWLDFRKLTKKSINHVIHTSYTTHVQCPFQPSRLTGLLFRRVVCWSCNTSQTMVPTERTWVVTTTYLSHCSHWACGIGLTCCGHYVLWCYVLQNVSKRSFLPLLI